MNLEKLRKATELMREALDEIDPSTGDQGASGGCGAETLAQPVRMPLPAGHGDTYDRLVGGSLTETGAPLANDEAMMIAGVDHCPGSDKWNCKYCRQVKTCEENRRIMAAPPVRIKVGREDWARLEEMRRLSLPIPCRGGPVAEHAHGERGAETGETPARA